MKFYAHTAKDAQGKSVPENSGKWQLLCPNALGFRPGKFFEMLGACLHITSPFRRGRLAFAGAARESTSRTIRGGAADPVDLLIEAGVDVISPSPSVASVRSTPSFRPPGAAIGKGGPLNRVR